MTMLVLGGFAFSVDDDTALNNVKRKLTTGYQSIPRLANFPIQQLNSLVSEKLSLRGTWYLPDVNENISNLRKAIYTGRPMKLSSGGIDLGEFVVLSYDEMQTKLRDNGNAYEVRFTIELERYH